MLRHVSPDVPTVLLVDSTSDDRMMYAEYLRICGLDPIEADDTADGLRRAKTADVIVTGIRVKGPFDGVELVRRLRATDGAADKPIIVLTACAYEPDRQRAHAAGCDVFLPKPCLPETLVREIRRIVAGRLPDPPPVPGRRQQRSRTAATRSRQQQQRAKSSNS